MKLDIWVLPVPQKYYIPKMFYLKMEASLNTWWFVYWIEIYKIFVQIFLLSHLDQNFKYNVLHDGFFMLRTIL